MATSSPSCDSRYAHETPAHSFPVPIMPGIVTKSYTKLEFQFTVFSSRIYFEVNYFLIIIFIFYFV
jgi:hypothetical protein